MADQFESAWKDRRTSALDFLRNTPTDLPNAVALRELVRVEISLRAAAGEKIEPSEYAPLEQSWIESLIAESKKPLDDQATKSVNAPSANSLADDDLTLTVARQVQNHPQDRQSGNSNIGGLDGYEIISEIARGGMGVVYRARQIRLNRSVALKMIRSGEFAGREEIARFQAEAEAAALLDHPGIVPIFEIGEHDGNPFFSMGLVEGESLSAKLREGPMPSRAAAELVKRISEAVAFAHKAGVIHRDLKPGNVLIDKTGEPKVTDFGLAKNLAGDSELTGTGQILGTPSYMPPEQATGDAAKVNERADVYALGAILYSCLVNRPPFQAPTPMETLKQVLEREPVPPRTLDAKIPRDLETICLKCLRKEPGKRYPHADELAEDLGRWLRNEPIIARCVSRLEKGWMWCRRHPVATLSSVAAVLALLVGSLVAYEWRNQSRADALVNGLVGAEPAHVMEFVDQVVYYRRWVLADLATLATQTPANPSDHRQLHAQMALVGNDPELVYPLVDELLKASPSYLLPISLSLKDHADVVGPELRKVLRRESEPIGRRFRAATVLASFEPESNLWTKADFQMIVDQLADQNPVHQPEFWPLLKKVSDRLFPLLEELFKDPDQSESRQLAATNAIVDFAGEDRKRLANLLVFATPRQFSVLYPIVAAGKSRDCIKNLAKIAAELPPDELGFEERIAFGQRRANAAVTLLRMGEVEKVLPVFEWTDDPEAMTQFVFRCRERNVRVDSLLGCLDIIDSSPPGRYPADTRYALLLTLGEFKLDEIPESQRDNLLAQIADWYANDPSSGVHGASGWLLRHWGQAETARKIEQSEVPYSVDREWFTLRIEVQPEKAEGVLSFLQREPPKRTFYYTFIVHPAGEYWIGSVEDEPDRQKKHELRRQVELTRPFAVLDREITFEELIAFLPGRYSDYMQQIDGVPADAGAGVSWYDSVGFSRWLGKQAGMPEEQQAYVSPDSLNEQSYPRDPAPRANLAPRNWPVELGRQGFRLPTESEWESIVRAGSKTAYGFGSDVSVLRRYGWFLENSDKHAHPPRELRPSLNGLFDVHGNLEEWTHDWFGISRMRKMADPLGPPSGNARVFHGGSWGFDASYCRTACRGSDAPSHATFEFGLRLALSLPFDSPEAEKEPAEQRPEMP